MRPANIVIPHAFRDLLKSAHAVCTLRHESSSRAVRFCCDKLHCARCMRQPFRVIALSLRRFVPDKRSRTDLQLQLVNNLPAALPSECFRTMLSHTRAACRRSELSSDLLQYAFQNLLQGWIRIIDECQCQTCRTGDHSNTSTAKCNSFSCTS
jgi:hypothetical protein